MTSVGNVHCEADWEECPSIIRRYNPATLELASEVSTIVPEQIPEIIESAREAQNIWNDTPIKEKKRLIRQTIAYLLDHVVEIAQIISSETGKPRVESINSDVIAGIAGAQYSMESIEMIFKPKAIAFGKLSLFLHFLGRSSTVYYRPLGVIGIISPWNFPFGIPFIEVIMAVAAGNAVILKPSSETPQTGIKIQEIFDQVGYPKNLVQTIPGSGSKLGRALITGGVDRIIFTGSAEVGQKIMELAAQKCTPLTLELSGKDPMIVLEDADLDRATNGATWGAFVNAGQMCVGIKRIYVQSSVYEKFLTQFKEKVQKLKQGWGWTDSNISIGPLINESALLEMEQHVRTALNQGARLVIGGKRNADPTLKGYYFEPTILTDVTQSMAVVQREIFGPIVVVMPFDTDTHAIEWANDSPFALAGSVWTRNIKRGKQIAEKINSGTIILNNIAYTFGLTATPWGGRGKSGFGRTHGEFGFHELLEPHHIHIDTGKYPQELWWNPYNAVKLQANLDFMTLGFGRSMSHFREKFIRIMHVLKDKK